MNQQNKEGVKPGGVKPGVVSLLWHYNKKKETIRKKEGKREKIRKNKFLKGS